MIKTPSKFILACFLIGTSGMSYADKFIEEWKGKTATNVIAYQKITHFDFLANLNKTVKKDIDKAGFQGLKSVFTIQKNNQIIINIIHDPFVGYQDLIEDIAQSAGRVNGVNLQDSMTLHILQNYCRDGNFYQIQARQLDEEVRVQYETLNGQKVAIHKINRKLCG